MALGSDNKVRRLFNEKARAFPVRPALDSEAQRRQRLRSIAIALALSAMAVMFYLVTIIRLGANVANRAL